MSTRDSTTPPSWSYERPGAMDTGIVSDAELRRRSLIGPDGPECVYVSPQGDAYPVGPPQPMKLIDHERDGHTFQDNPTGPNRGSPLKIINDGEQYTGDRSRPMRCNVCGRTIYEHEEVWWDSSRENPFVCYLCHDHRLRSQQAVQTWSAERGLLLGRVVLALEKAGLHESVGTVVRAFLEE